MANFLTNQVAPVNANAGVTNTQTVNQNTTYPPGTAAAQAAQTAVGSTPASSVTGFLGLDVGTWLTLIGLALYFWPTKGGK